MIRFGTDGIRGTAGTHPITVAVAQRIGAAAVRLAGTPGPTIVVCRDTRPSGASLENAVAAGIAGAGGTALRGGILPTAAVATGLQAGLAHAGIMITASHNGAPDNGFKLFTAPGRKLTDAENTQVELWLDAADAPGDAIASDDHDAVLHAYTAAALVAFGDMTALSGQRIAIDLSNGAAVALKPWLSDVLPCEIVWVASGEGIINDGVGSQETGELAKAIITHQCMGGFAVDGDADRCVLVDERGETLPGDALAWLLATGLEVKGIAITVMSNAALEPALGEGIRVVRTAVGDRHLAAAMAKHGLELGCEESGHVLFADGLPAGDGLVSGIRALCMALKASPTLSEATASFVPFPRYLTKVVVAERPPLHAVKPLEQARLQAQAGLGPGGRIFLRYSGTEPILRLLVEGRIEADVHAASTHITAVAAEVLS